MEYEKKWGQEKQEEIKFKLWWEAKQQQQRHWEVEWEKAAEAEREHKRAQEREEERKHEIDAEVDRQRRREQERVLQILQQRELDRRDARNAEVEAQSVRVAEAQAANQRLRDFAHEKAEHALVEQQFQEELQVHLAREKKWEREYAALQQQETFREEERAVEYQKDLQAEQERQQLRHRQATLVEHRNALAEDLQNSHQDRVRLRALVIEKERQLIGAKQARERSRMEKNLVWERERSGWEQEWEVWEDEEARRRNIEFARLERWELEQRRKLNEQNKEESAAVDQARQATHAAAQKIAITPLLNTIDPPPEFLPPSYDHKTVRPGVIASSVPPPPRNYSPSSRAPYLPPEAASQNPAKTSPAAAPPACGSPTGDRFDQEVSLSALAASPVALNLSNLGPSVSAAHREYAAGAGPLGALAADRYNLERMKTKQMLNPATLSAWMSSSRHDRLSARQERQKMIAQLQTELDHTKSSAPIAASGSAADTPAADTPASE